MPLVSLAMPHRRGRGRRAKARLLESILSSMTRKQVATCTLSASYAPVPAHRQQPTSASVREPFCADLGVHSQMQQGRVTSESTSLIRRQALKRLRHGPCRNCGSFNGRSKRRPQTSLTARRCTSLHKHRSSSGKRLDSGLIHLEERLRVDNTTLRRFTYHRLSHHRLPHHRRRNEPQNTSRRTHSPSRRRA